MVIIMKKKIISLLCTAAIFFSVAAGTVSAVAPDTTKAIKDLSGEYSSLYKDKYWTPGGTDAKDFLVYEDNKDEATLTNYNDMDLIMTSAKKPGVETVPAGTIANSIGGGLSALVFKNSKVTDTGSRTLHFRYTFVESTSPIILKLEHYKDDGSKGYVTSTFTMKNNQIIYVDNGRSINIDTKLNTGLGLTDLQAPYTVDFFQNTYNGEAVIYVAGRLLYDSRPTGAQLKGKWSKSCYRFQFVTAETDSNFRFVLKNAHHDVYSAEIPMEDVINYVMNNKTGENTNYLWMIDGINTGWKNIQGAMDGAYAIDGNNENGYTITASGANVFARYFLNSGHTPSSGTTIEVSPLSKSKSDKILWQSFMYKPSNLTGEQLFRIRGNNAYLSLLKAKPATATEPAQLMTVSGSDGGEKICVLDSNKFYKIDLIVNNKDYRYYVVVDGRIVMRGTLWTSVQPLWQTVFAFAKKDDSMTLKNVRTTVYDSTVGIYDVLSEAATSVYTRISGSSYDEASKELTVEAAIDGNADAFENGTLYYAVYDPDGALAGVTFGDVDNSSVNKDEHGRTYPHGVFDLSAFEAGTVLNIKAFLWGDNISPLSNAAKSSFTIPASTAETDIAE